MDGEKPTNTALQPKWQGGQRSSDASTAISNLRLAFIGIGRTGSCTGNRLRALRIPFATSIIIDTEDRETATSKTGQHTAADNYTMTPSSSAQFTLSHGSDLQLQQHLQHVLSQVDTVFFATSMNRDIDMKVASLIAKTARNKGVVTVGAITASSTLEQKRRQQIPHILATLQNDCEMVVVLDSTNITEAAPHLPQEGTREISSQALANVLIHLVEAISTPSLDNPDPQDSRTIVANGGPPATSNAESDSPNKLEEAVRHAVQNVTDHSIIQTTRGNTQGPAPVIQVIGNRGLTVEEVTHAREIVQEWMPKETEVVWGSEVRPELKGRIRVVLLMTGLTSPRLNDTPSSLSLDLFNLDPESRVERTLPIELKLYQLESF